MKDFWEGDDPQELKNKIIFDGGWTDEWIKLTISDLLEINDLKEAVFEIGAGCGRLLKYLRDNRNKTVFGNDYSGSMVKLSRDYMGDNSITLCDGSGKINMKDRRCDVVFSVLCFQHIRDINVVKKYIKEAYRILRPNSLMTFQLLAKSIGEGGISDCHDIDSLVGFAKECGFTHIRTKYVNLNAVVFLRKE